MNEVYIAEFSDTTGAVVEKFFASYDAAIKWARAKAKVAEDLSEESYVAKDGTEITEVSWSKKYSGFLVAKDREIGYTVTIRKAMPFEVPEDFAARHAAAASLGRAGGQAKTSAKATASRANGKRGGRPRNTDDCRVSIAGHVYTASYVPADGECPECWTVQPDYGDWDRDPDREEALEALADKLTKRWRSPWRVEYSDYTIVRG